MTVGTKLAHAKRVVVRITVVDEGDERSIVVEGRLAGQAVEKLEEAAGALDPPVRLRLGHLISVDEAGLKWLRGCRARGFEVAEARGVIAHQLEEDRKARQRPQTANARGDSR